MSNKTALYQAHVAAKAKLVDFHGWLLPLHYGSQIEEHHAVRQAAGMFDVSHMNIVDIAGQESGDFLRYLLANDVAKLTRVGMALYTVMLNAEAGIIDDLIVYKTKAGFRLVLNSATAVEDKQWLLAQAKDYAVTITPREDLSMIAVQGPKAREKVMRCFPSDAAEQLAQLKPFQFLDIADYLIASTGYTGEAGFEIILPNTQAPHFWDLLLAEAVQPCGLGARDTLRLEAGLNLYGNDMDLSHDPFTSNVAWTIAFEPTSRDFIGRQRLLALKDKPSPEKLCGLVLLGKGVLRADLAVYRGAEKIGQTTSGTFSPTLGCGIAMARLQAVPGEEVTVFQRQKPFAARVVALPFVRRGKSFIENRGD